jgi:SAM-dependent methyltransferase
VIRRGDPRRLVSARGADGEVERLRRQLTRVERENAKLRGRVERLVAKKTRLQERLASPPAQVTAVAEVPGMSRLEVRRQCVLASVRADPSVLEIGPAHNAILPKRDGYRTKTVDYLDRAGLIERYKDFPQYSPDDIEDVDYVLPPGAAMADVIDERFDLVVASHVIEHTTSLIDFVNECSRLLSDGGVLALVVPDHRYCFDRFRERAAIGRVIDASLAPPAVHTVGSVTEEKLNATRHRGSTAWLPGHRGTYSLIYDAADAAASGEEARRADHYIDTHNWVTTPHHLRLLMQDLADLGYISLRESFFRDTVRHEFFLNLKTDGPGTGLSREELLVLSEAERITMDSPEFGEAPVP